MIQTCIGWCLDFDVGLDAAADGQEGVAVPPALAEVVDADAEIFRHLLKIGVKTYFNYSGLRPFSSVEIQSLLKETRFEPRNQDPFL